MNIPIQLTPCSYIAFSHHSVVNDSHLIQDAEGARTGMDVFVEEYHCELHNLSPPIHCFRAWRVGVYSRNHLLESAPVK